MKPQSKYTSIQCVYAEQDALDFPKKQPPNDGQMHTSGQKRSSRKMERKNPITQPATSHIFCSKD